MQRRVQQEENKSKCSEAVSIIRYVRENEFVKPVTFTPNEHSILNYLTLMIKEILFSLLILILRLKCDGLWLTDVLYKYIDQSRRRKVCSISRTKLLPFPLGQKGFPRFATELIVENPELIKIKQIGHGLDKAQMRGFPDIFTTTKILLVHQAHICKRC